MGSQQLEKQLYKLGHGKTCVDVSVRSIQSTWAWLTHALPSQQPWSTYALHIATFTSLSFAFDPFILFVLYKATETWTPDHQFYALIAQLTFMAITKVTKLIGLFVREPSDFMYLPVSVLFGYFHGLIKLYALFTLRMVSHVLSSVLTYPWLTYPQTSWGSRADGDVNNNHRMSPRARRSESITLPPGYHPGLIWYEDEKTILSETEKGIDVEAEKDDDPSESDLDLATDDSDDDSQDDFYDDNDSQYSKSSSTVIEPLGR